MPSQKDELAERRFAKLVDQVSAMMSASLKPEYRGFYGQLILSQETIAELGEPADVRRAARAAGRRLGWRVRTHATDDGTLFIIDDRDPPPEVRELAGRRSAEAVSVVIASGRAEARMRRTSASGTLPSGPRGTGEDL
ncbi:hypothetical protein GCM10009850_087480 [Nonomuraea monospora]|uniref:Uncharacterized protein n=1 Tax=Nonomuraea monospora TaxID=568818 RepID=A0ABP5PNN9_9ACTN